MLPIARFDEVDALIETRRLFGRGLGYVDVHLIASALLVSETLIWTRDKRLLAIAVEFGIAAAL